MTRSRLRGAKLVAAALVALLIPLTVPGGDALAQAGAKPTIVLVHGAFADASGFGAVTSRLQRRGYTVIAPANPLRGPASDAAYVAGVLKQIQGPIVLVGHSYGGAVISEAATQVSNVKALVYLDALALEEGESNADISRRFPNPGFLGALRPQPFPQADGTEGIEFFIDPAAFHSVFAADVPARVAAVMASAQRPLALAGDQEKSTAPAWKTIPSWYLVGRQDRIYANAHTIEINSSCRDRLAGEAVLAPRVLSTTGFLPGVVLPRRPWRRSGVQRGSRRGAGERRALRGRDRPGREEQNVERRGETAIHSTFCWLCEQNVERRPGDRDPLDVLLALGQTSSAAGIGPRMRRYPDPPPGRSRSLNDRRSPAPALPRQLAQSTAAQRERRSRSWISSPVRE